MIDKVHTMGWFLASRVAAIRLSRRSAAVIAFVRARSSDDMPGQYKPLRDQTV